MIHLQIPRSINTLYNKIDCIEEDHDAPSSIAISNSLSYYLMDIKQRIEHQENEWDIYKRYTNPYEYIHTCIPGKRKCIAKIKPLSRSYFKMIELTRFFRLLETPTIEDERNSFRSFHLAEGPGGFIEALVHMRNNRNDKYIGMTILDDAHDPNIPAWKKSQQFMRENPNVTIETGADGTGDILNITNFEHCYTNYASSMHMITGDGGFDFSVDFNSQEKHITKLLFAQAVYAIIMQRKNGCFILKVFDCFMESTLDILTILSSFYEKVYITKPQTSRYANSEKYLVCSGFHFATIHHVYPRLHSVFQKVISCRSVSRFLNVPLTLLMQTKMEEYNAIFGQQQIENIHYTLSLLEHKNKQDKVDKLIKNNAQKCIHWCAKYQVPCNQLVPTTNVFFDEHGIK
jgi:23S rRNA U2552 (ribose-2'-O)-methylase RlmE/FtsJ